jgi:hypothetical protein
MDAPMAVSLGYLFLYFFIFYFFIFFLDGAAPMDVSSGHLIAIYSLRPTLGGKGGVNMGRWQFNAALNFSPVLFPCCVLTIANSLQP